jgi:MYXO-CTERM domain-containing protein
VSANAIAGRYSLSSGFAFANDVQKFLPPQTRLRLTAKLDFRTVTATAQFAPIILSLTSRSAGFDPVWVYISTDSNVVQGLAVNTRVFRSASNFEDARYMTIPTRPTLRVDWERATGPGSGLVRVYVDGGLLWTSRATGDTRTTVDSLVLGNSGGDRLGTGAMLMDDILLETCPGVATDGGAATPDAAALDSAPAAPDAAADFDASAADRPPRVVPVPDVVPDDAASVDAASADSTPEDAPGAVGGVDGATSANDGSAGVKATEVHLNVGCACTVGRRDERPGALVLLVALALRRRRR